MAKAKEVYENIAAKAARGEYSLVDPLDFLVLGFLPDEGTLFAGLYPLGETVPNLAIKLDKKIETSQLSARMNVMHKQGLVAKKNSVGRAAGQSKSIVWQRTKQGASIYKKWKDAQSVNGKGAKGGEGVSGG